MVNCQRNVYSKFQKYTPLKLGIENTIFVYFFLRKKIVIFVNAKFSWNLFSKFLVTFTIREQMRKHNITCSVFQRFNITRLFHNMINNSVLYLQGERCEGSRHSRHVHYIQGTIHTHKFIIDSAAELLYVRDVVSSSTF